MLFSGVAGGAASGKTTVCDMIMQQLHDQRAVVVNQVILVLDMIMQQYKPFF
jgi:dephospho-CoA kinase